MKFVVVGTDGCLASSFAGFVDFLQLAHSAIQVRTGGDPAFEVISVSRSGQDIRDSRACQVQVNAAMADINGCAALFVPGSGRETLLSPPDTSSLKFEAAWIQRQHDLGALVCGSYGGTYLLGQAGLLDNRRCTTAWWLHDEVKRRYPSARAVWGRALVEDQRVVTAGGPFSWVILTLHALRHLCGPQAARIASDFAVTDGLPRSMGLPPNSGALDAEAFVMRAERTVRLSRATKLGARELAHQLAMSERTLHRRLAASTGESVKQFIDRVRVEEACAALATDGIKVKQVAYEAGFEDEASFRRVFKRIVGTTPGAYRAAALSDLEAPSDQVCSEGD